MPGPAADPLALRRDRKDDQSSWSLLPIEGFTGPIPIFPLKRISIYNVFFVNKERFKEYDKDASEAFGENEIELWELLWRKPQATQWVRLGLKFQVAAYVRAFLESNLADASSGLKTAVLRMEDGLGISVKGLNTLRWKIVADEVAVKRGENQVKDSKGSIRDRIKAVNDGDA